MFRKLSILVLAVSAIAVAEISLGVDVLYRVNDYEYERESSESNQEIESGNSTLNLMPFLGIRPNDIIEVSPFFGYYLYVGKRKESNQSSSNESKSSQHGIEPGIGIYFHLFNNSDIIDFSLGPKTSYRINFPAKENDKAPDYDKYIDGIFSVACQVNIDLHFNKHFAARLSSNLYGFSIDHTKTKVGNPNVSTKNVSIVSELRTFFTPSLGFYFTF